MLARAVQNISAGTVEFLVDEEKVGREGREGGREVIWCCCYCCYLFFSY